MKILRLPALILASVTMLFSTGCAEGKYNKNDTGITVNLSPTDDNGVRKVRLQVLGDKIIRVSATPDRKFSKDESLVTVPQTEQAQFTVEENDTSVWLLLL